MDATAQAYSDAYVALHGNSPSVKMNGARYSVVTGTGFFADYTKRDLSNLTHALIRMASR